MGAFLRPTHLIGWTPIGQKWSSIPLYSLAHWNSRKIMFIFHWSPVFKIASTSFNIMNNQSDCMHEAFQISWILVVPAYTVQFLSWILVERYNWVTALEKQRKTLCHSCLNVLQCKHMPSKPGLSSLFKIQNLGLCHALHLLCYQPHGLADLFPRELQPHRQTSTITPGSKLKLKDKV